MLAAASQSDRPAALSSRIGALDEYRGYAIFGMILVNYLGIFPSMPDMFKHHHGYMSYADTIAPVFVFVVGIAFRLSLLRSIERMGRGRAMLRAARRYVVLCLIGVVIYNPFDWSNWWDALVDIGLAGILSLPFIASGTTVRFLAAFGYLLVYQVIFSFTAYGGWLMHHSFDGGPLGPLSWVFMLLLGTVAYDFIAARDHRRLFLGFVLWGVGLSLFGWLLRMEWGGTKDFWPFSQTAMTMPYALYATGLAFLAYLPFVLLREMARVKVPSFAVMGTNPLLLYVLQAAICVVRRTFVPVESGVLLPAAEFLAVYLACHALARYLYDRGKFIKV